MRIHKHWTSHGHLHALQANRDWTHTHTHTHTHRRHAPLLPLELLHRSDLEIAPEHLICGLAKFLSLLTVRCDHTHLKVHVSVRQTQWQIQRHRSLHNTHTHVRTHTHIHTNARKTNTTPSTQLKHASHDTGRAYNTISAQTTAQLCRVPASS